MYALTHHHAFPPFQPIMRNPSEIKMPTSWTKCEAAKSCREYTKQVIHHSEVVAHFYSECVSMLSIRNNHAN